jgi:hypothetical protein
MGHFEKGAWKEDPLDNLIEAGELLTLAFLATGRECEKYLMTEVGGYFEQGRWISIRMIDLPSLMIKE